MRRGSASLNRIVSLLVVLCLFLPSRADSASSFAETLEPPPGLVLRAASDLLVPGGNAFVTIDVKNSGDCSLLLGAPGGVTSTRSSVQLQTGRLEWRWRVPENVRRGLWRAEISCRRSNRRLVATHLIRMEVRAPAPGAADLIGPNSLSAEAFPTPNSITDPIPVILALLAAIGLLYTHYQLRHTRASAREARTYEYLRRYNEPEMAVLTSRVRRFVRVSPAAPNYNDAVEAKWETWIRQTRGTETLDPASGAATKAEVEVFMNFFETLGGQFNHTRQFLDRDLVANQLAYVARLYFTECRWLILRQRLRYGEDHLCEWEKMIRILPVAPDREGNVVKLGPAVRITLDNPQPVPSDGQPDALKLTFLLDPSPDKLWQDLFNASSLSRCLHSGIEPRAVLRPLALIRLCRNEIKCEAKLGMIQLAADGEPGWRYRVEKELRDRISKTNRRYVGLTTFSLCSYFSACRQR